VEIRQELFVLARWRCSCCPSRSCDYWIIGLDKDYSYAIVGTPNRKYGWILSRTPKLSPDKLNLIYATLREQGYNPEDFEMTPQDEQ